MYMMINDKSSYKFNFLIKIATVIVMVCFGSSTIVRAQMQVTANQTATVLAQRLAGQGITITNASLNCANNANGVFKASSTNLNIDSGIVLSTGLVGNINQAEPGVISTNNNRNGDPDLQPLSGANVTRDACILEFDIIPKGTEVKFDYVFASEEYVNSVCGPYNDAFAFFISGPGINGTANMASVPNTNIPVAINSINNGIPGSLSNGTLTNCTNMGTGSPFVNYYINNQNGSSVAFRGFTTVLTAKSIVQPCATYHLKITIADAQNALYDSGVFIKAGSLQATSVSLVAQGATATNADTAFIARGCTAGNITVTRSGELSNPLTIQMQYGGSAVAGIDYNALPSSITIPANSNMVNIPVQAINAGSFGKRVLTAYAITPFTCNNTISISDSAVLAIVDAPQISMLTADTSVCVGSSFTIRLQGDHDLEYQWSPVIGLDNASLRDPLVTVTAPISYAVTATLPNSGCSVATATIAINTTTGPTSIAMIDSVYTCSSYGISVDAIVLPSAANFIYHWQGPLGYQSALPQLQIPNPQMLQTGWYSLTVSATGCSSITDSVFVLIVDQVPLPYVVSPLQFCSLEDKALYAKGKDLKWYLDAHSNIGSDVKPEINTHNLGSYYYYVTQSYGTCESAKATIEVMVTKCCQESFFVPTAFSPNGDGLNDYFAIQLDADSKMGACSIYNRWGQRVYIQVNNRPWDGTFNGERVEVGDYMYDVEIICKDGKTHRKKGVVTLIR
jgi:gliding motility-associated-like protein